MTLIGLCRLLAGYGAGLSVGEGKQRSPTNGRQDKAGGPAAVAALLSLCLHVVLCAARDGSLRCACGS